MFEASPLRVSKLSATENDFLLIGLTDASSQKEWLAWTQNTTPERIARWACDRYNGVGADGILVLHPTPTADFKWEFYNQDGSSAEMCGNAARCAVLWAEREMRSQREFAFETLSGRVTGSRLENNLIQVSMPEVKVQPSELQFTLGGLSTRGFFVNTGVPHFVVEVENFESRPRLTPVAREIRAHPHFGVGGTNVTFVKSLSNQVVSALTFERGVEDFTRSCGTGAVAAAVWSRQKTSLPLITVQVPGGELMIDLKPTKPTLTGPAHWVSDCYLHTHSMGLKWS